jgi:Ni,Fe-hydrogenase III small subunit
MKRNKQYKSTPPKKGLRHPGLLFLALLNFWNTLLNRRSDTDIVQYPTANRESFRLRSLFLRHLDCGDCGGCIFALQRVNNPVWDIQKYNVNFESSPRHSHALGMTGPYVLNSQVSTDRTLEAMPIPVIVAIGDCAVDGGVFRGFYTLPHRPEKIKNAIIVEIPGCPPTPAQIESGLLQCSRKLKEAFRRTK